MNELADVVPMNAWPNGEETVGALPVTCPKSLIANAIADVAPGGRGTPVAPEDVAMKACVTPCGFVPSPATAPLVLIPAIVTFVHPVGGGITCTEYVGDALNAATEEKQNAATRLRI